jgi:hypothetical protein
MKTPFAQCALLAAMICLPATVAASPVSREAEQEDYNVVWDSPSADARGSMPLGNGDIGLNAWVEPGGDLCFYIGKTDSWGDNGRLLKVGKVRVTIDPAPSLTPFSQELSLRDASMVVSYGDGTRLRLWVDAHHPVVRLETIGRKPVRATAAIEFWRTTPIELPSIETSDVMVGNPQGQNTIVEPDTLLPNQSDRIGWYHHNVKSIGPALHAEVQGMTGYHREDPLLHRTFGAVITAPESKRMDDTHLLSASGRFDIYVLTRHPSTPEQWLADVNTLIRKAGKPDFAAHKKWWGDFWDRSWIQATSADRSSLFPTNDHQLRVGQDQSGQSRFQGEIRSEKIPPSLMDSFSLEAEVHPAAGETGRIFDQITPGERNGFLLDTWPGNALRLIVGDQERSVKDALPAGQLAKVVLYAGTDGWRVSVNGKTVITLPGNGDDEAAYVSQMVALQRFITTCGGRGRYPIKYNGSIFTVPSPGKPGDADYRRWGPGYWWQNTRLPYFSMPAFGDLDEMEPLFRMYVDDLLPLNQYRTKHYFGIQDAAYYAECIHFWGDVFNESYGWQPMAERKDPLQVSRYHKWEWVSGLELVSLLLDRYEHDPDAALLEKRLLPTANAVIRFFDGYYQTNDQGKLVMHPSQAAETWWECTNPMTELAGLHSVTARLLALPESCSSTADRVFWKTIQAKLPPLPTRDTPSGKAFSPAERFAQKENTENPELYAVFPFRLCSFEKDNRGLGVQALNHLWDRGSFGWRQDDLFMSHLGLADQARQAIVSRSRNHDPSMRFPAFWGPNFDWTPDQCHGGVLVRTFQTMLMQTEGEKIFLLPAWPKGWDVSFKLHAPANTIVEGVYRGGRFETLTVTPAARRKNLVMPPTYP